MCSWAFLQLFDYEMKCKVFCTAFVPGTGFGQVKTSSTTSLMLSMCIDKATSMLYLSSSHEVKS